MSMFGWDYPPGCHGTPWDDAEICQVCGFDVDSCICPPCKECGETGNPTCYESHGMTRTDAQVQAMRDYQRINSSESDPGPLDFEND
jgi:hypothetical protein